MKRHPQDLAGSGPGSRGPLDEAVAADKEREAPAVVVAGATPEDDEEDEGRGRGLLRWDGFSAWLHCVCVVGFDLELGQAVEVRPGRTLSPRRGADTASRTQSSQGRSRILSDLPLWFQEAAAAPGVMSVFESGKRSTTKQNFPRRTNQVPDREGAHV